MITSAKQQGYLSAIEEKEGGIDDKVSLVLLDYCESNWILSDV